MFVGFLAGSVQPPSRLAEQWNDGGIDLGPLEPGAAAVVLVAALGAQACVVVAKNRDGPPGQVRLGFGAETTAFTSMGDSPLEVRTVKGVPLEGRAASSEAQMRPPSSNNTPRASRPDRHTLRTLVRQCSGFTLKTQPSLDRTSMERLGQ
ncbi:MAG: hypothetical protein ACJAZO_003736 [Myxococcota bacterium]